MDTGFQILVFIVKIKSYYQQKIIIIFLEMTLIFLEVTDMLYSF